MIKAQDTTHKPVTFTSNSTAKKVEKVYSTKSDKRISPISDKQAKRLAEYRKVRDKFMKENPICEVCGNLATDLHHAAGRVGDLLTDIRYFKALCRHHHQFIELHPLEAKRMGLSVNRLDKTA